MIYIQGIMSQC